MASQYLELAALAYAHAERNYGRKGARYDVIVECMSIADIATEMAEQQIPESHASAKAWADRQARMSHEQELNQAWDGPESCIGSEMYDPSYDPSKY